MHVGIGLGLTRRNITATSFRHSKVRAKVKVEVTGEKGKYWEIANGKQPFSPGKYSRCMAVISCSPMKGLMLHRTR